MPDKVKCLGLLIILFCCILDYSIAQETDKMVDINGAKIFCKTLGDGEPLVIVHGGPGLAHDYLFGPFKQLSDNYKLIFYDQRGCGKSQEFNEGESSTMETMVEDLEGVRKEFKLEKMNLVGQSWGAVIALNYIFKYPDRVKYLILLEPAPGSSEYIQNVQQTIMSRLNKEEIERLVKISQSPDLRTSPELFKEFMNIRMKTYFYNSTYASKKNFNYFDTERIKKFFASSALFGPYLMSYSLYDKMRNISCPTLIIHGDYDVIPTEAIERMGKEIKNAEMHIVKECGHFVHIEKPEFYFNTIRSFIK
jgi:proline iminopeptidase